MKQDEDKRIAAVFKPVGMTSHDVVDGIRAVTGIKRVGHAGTLDPLASGVLVVGIGRNATKDLARITDEEKEYRVTIELGRTSITDDAEGEKTTIPVSEPPDREKVKEVVKNFIGEIRQVPPAYSAVFVKGKRAYKLARRGKEVVLPPRIVSIKNIELLEYTYPLVKLNVVCGKGTYIRTLARDIGKALGTGGFVSALERTRVGSFTINNAVQLDSLAHLYLSKHVG